MTAGLTDQTHAGLHKNHSQSTMLYSIAQLPINLD